MKKPLGHQSSARHGDHWGLMGLALRSLQSRLCSVQAPAIWHSLEGGGSLCPLQRCAPASRPPRTHPFLSSQVEPPPQPNQEICPSPPSHFLPPLLLFFFFFPFQELFPSFPPYTHIYSLSFQLPSEAILALFLRFFLVRETSLGQLKVSTGLKELRSPFAEKRLPAQKTDERKTEAEG